jgi:hypothetical protein
MIKLSRRFSLVVIIATLSASVIGSSPAVAADTKASARVQDIAPEACMQCHEEIYVQWKASMHANSSAMNDPIHGAFYKKVMGDPTQEGVRGPQIPVKKDKYPVCLKCHAPVAAMDKKTKLDDNPAYANGVSCVTCHSFTKFKGVDSPSGKPQYGIDAYQYDTDSLHGPSGISYTVERVAEGAKWPTPVHHPQPMKGNNAALFKSNDACWGCHDKRKNFHGTPLCLTGAEYAKGESYANCQACHMAIVTVPKRKDGKVLPGEYVSIADHTMAGGHDDKMITRGIAMTMDTQQVGAVIKARLTLRNRLPHSYPTGAPFRNMYIRIAAYDEKGNELWKNYKTHPIKDDPKSAFWYSIGDVEKRKPTSPPFATGVLSDTRLAPNEVRELEYEIPVTDAVAIIRAEALYDLLLPPIKKKMQGKLPGDLLKSKLAASAEVRL